MPVSKITADQFVTRLNTGILERNTSHDVEIGAIPDIVTNPTAQVLERQNDRIRLVSQLILLNQSETFEDQDVEDFVFNEAILRSQGGRSSGTVTFSRATAPTANIVVEQNFPIATQPDEETGETVVFVTTESKTLFSATASSFFNVSTERYELEVSVQAVVGGKIGEVGPNRINRNLRPLVGFDSVTNINRTSTVSDVETNDDLLERYRISIIGTQSATRGGLRRTLLSNFTDAGDVLVVNAGDPLITRSGENSGAVDVFITGSQDTSRTDTQEFLGLSQVIPLDNQPVISITGIAGFVQGTDYEFVKDTTGVSGSTRAQDGIQFIPGGSSPSVGSSISVDYLQDVLVANMQSFLADEDNDVGGQDALVRNGTQVDITITSQLVILPGFSFSVVQPAVITAISTFINALRLGEDVERSDLQAEVRQISGVDNFIFSILDRVGNTGNADVSIEKNEFARIVTGDITVTS